MFIGYGGLKCFNDHCQSKRNLTFNLEHVYNILLIYIKSTTYNIAPYSCFCAEMPIDEVNQKK